jgi:alpha-methylacyl-CoA racemase
MSSTALRTRSGPLNGVRIVEFGGVGPGPFAAMLLADLGADVIRLAAPSTATDRFLPEGALDVQHRGRPSVTVNLKDPAGVDFALKLCDEADAVIEGNRPGVMERLGLGPEVMHPRNPRLVYGRITGYGQTGDMASRAGHDLNYIAIAGALGSMARPGEPPTFPINLLGDFGGGGMLIAFGVVCGLLEARMSGRGQVVDAAMVDGVATLTALLHGFRHVGLWHDTPGTNFLDGGAHFYDTYETSDGKYMAVGLGEPQFYARLLDIIGLTPEEAPQWDRERWPELKELFTRIFRSKTQQEWTQSLEPVDTCVTPVLSLAEAPQHHHNVSRGVFEVVNGIVQPAPAPRFDRTPGAIDPQRVHYAGFDEALAAWGISD